MVKKISAWLPEEDDQLKELYENNMASEHIARALGRTVESVDNRRRKTGLKRNFVLEKVPPPDDFVGMLNIMNVSQLMKHYGHARSVICRWIFELELTTIVRSGRKKVIPSNFDTVAPTMTCAELTRLYNANRATIVGWLRERGITPLSILERRELNANPAPIKIEEGHTVTRREINGRTKLVAAEAAHFLRRFHPSVHRADIKMFEHSSHTWGDVNNVPFRGINQYYIAGKGIMWSDDLIAYAESRGFKIKELT